MRSNQFVIQLKFRFGRLRLSVRIFNKLNVTSRISDVTHIWNVRNCLLPINFVSSIWVICLLQNYRILSEIHRWPRKGLAQISSNSKSSKIGLINGITIYSLYKESSGWVPKFICGVSYNRGAKSFPTGPSYLWSRPISVDNVGCEILLVSWFH